jgi:hypothetical protein
MHAITFVLLRPPIVDLRAAIDELLRPYRLNEDHYEVSWRYDYWTVGGGNITDAHTATAIGLTRDEDYGPNVCFVSRIGDRCIPVNIITPDGVWHGLADFGWKFRERDVPTGRAVYSRWCAHVAAVLAASHDCVAVEIDTHS